MARLMRDLGLELGVPVGAVMEGGYALEPLARGVALTMDVLRGGDGPYEDVGPGIEALIGAPTGGPVCGAPEALALEARARLRQYWPSLA
jgi:hypothetical protein